MANALENNDRIARAMPAGAPLVDRCGRPQSWTLLARVEAEPIAGVVHDILVPIVVAHAGRTSDVARGLHWRNLGAAAVKPFGSLR